MATLKTKIILLKELLALKEIVDKGSIQAAALENGIKNSNMSQLIKDLETRLNTKCIDRNYEGSIPTNSTQLIYSEIDVIEKTLDNILNKFANFDDLSGFISVWTEEGLIGSFIMQNMSAFYAQYPKIRLDLLMKQEPDIENTDILIIDSKVRTNIHGKILFKFKAHTQFYASKQYLNSHTPPKNLEDLLENHDLCMAKRYLNLPEYQSIVKRAKHLNTTSDSLALIYRLVNAGDGITVLPSWFEKYSHNLVALDTVPYQYETEVHCVCRTEIADSQKIRAFVSFFANFCREQHVQIEVLY